MDHFRMHCKGMFGAFAMRTISKTSCLLLLPCTGCACWGYAGTLVLSPGIIWATRMFFSLPLETLQAGCKWVIGLLLAGVPVEERLQPSQPTGVGCMLTHASANVKGISI